MLKKINCYNLPKIAEMVAGAGGKQEILSAVRITRPTLDGLLKGYDVKVSTLEKIAGALGVSVQMFFTGEIVESEASKTQFDSRTLQLSQKLIEAQEKIIDLMEENAALKDIITNNSENETILSSIDEK